MKHLLTCTGYCKQILEENFHIGQVIYESTKLFPCENFYVYSIIAVACTIANAYIYTYIITFVYNYVCSNGTLRNNIPMATNPLDSNDNEKTNHNQPGGEMHYHI